MYSVIGSGFDCKSNASVLAVRFRPSPQNKLESKPRRVWGFLLRSSYFNRYVNRVHCSPQNVVFQIFTEFLKNILSTQKDCVVGIEICIIKTKVNKTGCYADGYTTVFWKHRFVGSNPTTQTKNWNIGLMAMMFDCLSSDTGSIPVCSAMEVFSLEPDEGFCIAP